MSDELGRRCYGGMKLYGKRDTMAQGAHYTRHVRAMTAEGLHAKSDIAAELAHRDMEIDCLRAEIECWRTKGRGLRLSDPEMAETVARLKHRIKTDKEFARRLLNDAGIVGADGKLTPLYRD